MRRTDLQLAADRRAADQRRALADQLARLLDDTGVTQRQLAEIAGVGQGFVSDLLAHRRAGSLQTYHRLAAALNADLALRLYPNAGPHIRDRWQAPMIEELLQVRHPRWEPYPEVLVTRPVRGWIDLVLHERREHALVASEVQSELRRFEQLVRWQAAKAAALPSWDGYTQLGEAPRISQLIVVRRTRATRQVVAELGRQVRIAFPAHPDDAIAALTGATPWPGPALAWMVVDATGARFVPGR